MPCALYIHFDKETDIFGEEVAACKDINGAITSWTTRAHANGMERRYGATIHHDAGQGSSTILPPNPPASIRAWTSRAAARGRRSMTTG
jgi:hypothetical protein